MSALAVYLLCLFLQVGKNSAVTYVPCDSNQGSSDGHSLPELPNTFSTIIEANIVKKQFSTVIEAYHDETNKRSSIVTRSQGKQTQYFTDFNTFLTTTVFENDTCSVTESSQSNKNIFGFSLGPHISSVKDILTFGVGYGESYVGGNTKIRGVLADHWTTCLQITESQIQFTLDYYFTLTSSGTPRVPLRAIISGSGPSGDFENYYDFISFQPGPVQDESVFEVPVGIFCARTESVAMPAIPDFFSAGLEVIVKNGNHGTDSVSRQIYYDYQSKVVRIDYSKPPTIKAHSRYGNRAYTVIQDYNASLEFVIDRLERNCTITSLSTDSDGMHHPARFLNITADAMTYQGKKTWRGLRTDAWAAVDLQGFVTEVFFLDVTGRPRNQGDPPSGTRLVGLLSHRGPIMDPAVVGPSHVEHFYGFESGHPEQNVFDVTTCYSFHHRYSHLTLIINGTYDSVWYHQLEFYAGIRAAIARAAKVSVIRVTSLQAEHAGTDNQMRIFFKLLSSVPSSPDSSDDRFTSLEAAKLNMLQSVQQKFAARINFGYAQTETFTAVYDSLRELSSSETTVKSAIQGHSSGSMAGLAIGMLVIGALLGLLGAFVIFRRYRTDVPYKLAE